MKRNLRLIVITVLLVALNLGVVSAESPVFDNYEDAKNYIGNEILNYNDSIKLRITDGVVESGDVAEGAKKLSLDGVTVTEYTKLNHTGGTHSILPVRIGNDFGLQLTLEYNFITTEEEDEYVKRELEEVVTKIKGENDTLVDILKAVNEYVVLNTEYSTDTEASPHGAYAVIKEGKGVCSGYTLVTNLMLDMLGIENKVIEGETLEGVLHSWNLVKLQGDWYHLDTTHNDPVPNVEGRVLETYLLRDDEYMKRTRIWDYESYPEAISSSYTHLEGVEYVVEEVEEETKPELLDESYSDWAEKEILKAIDYSIVNENILSNFQQDITREEFAELLVNIYDKLGGKEVGPVIETIFEDTANKSVLKANTLGIVSGVGNNRFEPNSNITREQIATMLDRLLQALEINPIVTMEIRQFADSSNISTWADSSIQLMNKLGIINGVGDNRIEPKGTTSREQAIVLSVRMVDKFLKN